MKRINTTSKSHTISTFIMTELVVKQKEEQQINMTVNMDDIDNVNNFDGVDVEC